MEADPDYFEIVQELNKYPEAVVIDLSKPVNRIRSVFQYDISPEFIVDQAIEACGSRGSAERDIAKFSSRLLKDLKDWNDEIDGEGRLHTPFGFQKQIPEMEDIVLVVEQATLDIFDKLVEYKLHGRGGFTPYQFDHILSDGSVLLRKTGSPEEFFDRVAYTNA